MADVEQLFDENTLEEMEQALNIVNETLKHEPIFNDDENLLRQDLDDAEEEEDNTIEDIVVGVYNALPDDAQQNVRDGYLYMTERYFIE